MTDLTRNFKDKLTELGADMIEIGNLYEIPSDIRKNMPYGIVVAVAYDPEIIKGIEENPTKEYYQAYKKLNDKLDMLVTFSSEYLKKLGYKAYPQTTSVVSMNETEYNSILPHKTVATRAGLGWIGKSALLVTEKYGSAIRISTILTNAPLNENKPINESKCGDCMICTKACPAEAIVGCNWDIKKVREDIFDAVKCRKIARQIAFTSFGIEITQCGRCINVCPYTRKYINSN